MTELNNNIETIILIIQLLATMFIMIYFGIALYEKIKEFYIKNKQKKLKIFK
ncbi:MAG: hypothetical protein LBF97_06080 [Elusimicrobiota bacterium]|jgi:hypothetical protein|nr:hypothetical protein [Elusimicrobiota bacterium]